MTSRRHRQLGRVGSLLAVALVLVASASAKIVGPAEPPPVRPPLVVAAQVPLYPALLLKAHIDGEVRVRITTDGNQASNMALESGGTIFLAAAEENIRTWQFERHQPTTFVTVFRYKLLSESQCFTDAPTVVLHLPTEVEVTSKGLAICEDLAPSANAGGLK